MTMIRLIATLLCVNFFLLSPIASAGRPRLGEWESSGEPEPPYFPRPPVNYRCTVEVVINKGSKTFIGRTVHDFKTSDFKESGVASYTLATNEKWKIHPDMKPADVKALQLFAAGQSIQLSFNPTGEGTEELGVRTNARLALLGETLMSSGTAFGPRAGGVVYSDAIIIKEVLSAVRSYYLSVATECEEKR